MKTYAIMLLLAMLLLSGCTSQPQPAANNTPGSLPVISAANNTLPVLKPIPPDSSVDVGDTVSVDYTLRVDGKVLDTSNATLAHEAGTFSPGRQYVPLNFTVEFNKGMIDGFIIGVIGMKVGETQSFAVDPARGYGLYDPTKVVVVQRYYQKPLSEDVPRSYLEARGINISVGAGFNTAMGAVFIRNVTNDTVTLFYVLLPGSEFSTNGIPQKVVGVSNLTATVEFKLEQNETYVLPDPSTGAQARFTVIGKDNDTITLDANHQLANKTLEFTVTMLGAERAS